MDLSNPKILKGGVFTDERGELLYNNEFDLSMIKRMYTIKHPDKSIVRAWQGHQQEHNILNVSRAALL